MEEFYSSPPFIQCIAHHFFPSVYENGIEKVGLGHSNCFEHKEDTELDM